MKEQVTKTFTITTDEAIMKRFEKFLCFFHYNGGHSGLFAMEFDGDGSDRFKVSPAPDKGNRDWSRIGDAGQSVEIAGTVACYSRPIDYNKHFYKVKDNELIKIDKDGKTEIRKVYEPN